MRYFIAFIIALLILWATTFAQVPLQSYVKFLGQSSWQPPAIVILHQTPEAIKICYERETGPVACRSVEEFKNWIQR